MARTLEQRTNLDGVPKAREVIEIRGGHALEASDRQIFNLLYQQAHDSGRLTDPTAEWEASLREIADRVSPNHAATDRVREALHRLMSVTVSVPNGAGYTLTHLFDFFDIPRAGQGDRFRFGIPRKLGPIIAGSTRWGRVRLDVVVALRSKYAVALYEMIRVRSGMKMCIDQVPIEEWREMMGVPKGAYERGNDLGRNVIQPAVQEVNELSEMSVAVEVVRRGRGPRTPIVAVQFGWAKKDPQALQDASRARGKPKSQRQRSLQGRKAKGETYELPELPFETEVPAAA